MVKLSIDLLVVGVVITVLFLIIQRQLATGMKQKGIYKNEDVLHITEIIDGAKSAIKQTRN